MTANITADALKAWRKKEGLTQEDFGQMIGWKKLVVTNIETGRRDISEPEQRLLKLLIYGVPPFPSANNANVSQIDFTHEEWSIMTKIAHKEGYHSARAWIVQKIRDCLAMRGEYSPQQQSDIAAEDPAPFGHQANGDVSHAG